MPDLALIRAGSGLVPATEADREIVSQWPEGVRMRCTVKDDDRSSEQNAKLHAMLSDIARQVEHAGSKWNVLIWKRLCTAAWLREIGESATMIPAIDGNGFDVIYEKTSKLGVKKCASLITWIEAFGSEHQVRWAQRDNWGGRY